MTEENVTETPENSVTSEKVLHETNEKSEPKTAENNASEEPQDWTDAEVESFFDSGGKVPQRFKLGEENGDQEGKTEEVSRTAESKSTDTDPERGETSTSKGTESNDSKADANRTAALQEARKENRLLVKELQELKERNNKLLNVIENAFQKETGEQAPSFEDDPVAALKYENNNLKKDISEIKETQNKTAEERKKENEEANFMRAYSEKVHDFSKTTPDFDKAYRYVLQHRFDEYKTLGFTDQEANSAVHEDERLIAAKALTDGANPGERIYNLARLRGYKNESKVNEPVKNQVNHQEAEKRVAQLERGIKASRTLNDASPSESKNMISLEEIAAMSEEELGKLDWDKHVLSRG